MLDLAQIKKKLEKLATLKIPRASVTDGVRMEKLEKDDNIFQNARTSWEMVSEMEKVDQLEIQKKSETSFRMQEREQQFFFFAKRRLSKVNAV